MSLTIGKYTVPYRLVQGGMGVRVSGANLASAVARCGGIGLIATAALAVNSPRFNGRNFFAADPLALKDELDLARELAPDVRVNAIIPPLALDGPCVTIRRFGSNPLKLEDLLNYKAFTPEMVMLLEGAMKARLNIVISGGTGSGKTTLLVLLALFFLGGEAIYGFSVALIVGIVVGTYSSIYVASPTAIALDLTAADLLPVEKDTSELDQLP